VTDAQNSRAKQITLMGIPIDALNEKEAIGQIIISDYFGLAWRSWWLGGDAQSRSVTHSVLSAWTQGEDRGGRHFVARGRYALVWASKLQGTPLPGRVAGSELILSLTTAAAEAGASIFLLGGNPGVGEEATRLMMSTNPGLKVAGILSPPMGFEKDREMVASVRDEIEAANPDLLRPANYSDIGRGLKPHQNIIIRGFELSLYYAGLNSLFLFRLP
jgi:N-acetylglucosaminyldiphosphoundecaprenol N-acetyl-beta-D-mannosaminyltransferase